MKQVIFRVFTLLLLYLHVTDAFGDSKIDEIAEKSRILDQFKEMSLVIRRTVQMNFLKKSEQNTLDHKNSISLSIARVSTIIEPDFHRLDDLISEFSVKKLEQMLQFVRILSNAVLAMASVVNQRPQENQFIRIKNMNRFLMKIHSNLNEYRTELDDSFLNWIGRKSIGDPYLFCGNNTSNLDILFHTVENLIVMEVISFAAAKLYYDEHKNSLAASASFIENYHSAMVNRSKSYMEIASNSVKNMSNIVYSCDITNYVYDDNYIELEGLLQPVFVSVNRLKSCEAANMHSNIRNSTRLHVSSSGEIMKKLRHNGLRHNHIAVFLSSPNEKPCNGYISDCAYHESMEICRNPLNSLKRYSWYKLNGSSSFGREDSCPNGMLEKFKNPQMHPELIYQCLCTCHDNDVNSRTTHVLSLCWAVSDVYQNKVVTGIKFTKIQNIIYLQIKQGTLIGDGGIEPGSEEWSPVTDIDQLAMDVEKRKTYDNSTFIILDENTIFDLDDIVSDPRWVVTGIRFHPLANQRVKILVRYNKFDWKTGKLDVDSMNRIIHPTPNRFEVPTSLKNPVLHKPKVPNMPDSVSNLHFVKLRESSRKTDGGGTILPFFDAQKVETHPSSPLNGVGLYHRGSSESGGLISIKLFRLNDNSMVDSTLRIFDMIE